MHQVKNGLAEIYGIELPENTGINFTGYVYQPVHWGGANKQKLLGIKEPVLLPGHLFTLP